MLKLFTIFIVVGLVNSNKMEVDKVFVENEIVPDVIDVAPKEIVEVSYPSGAKVNLGKELTPTQVKDIPEVKWRSESDALYTLLMTDPDAPTRSNATFREVRHWLVVNIPGNDISKGNTLFEYIGSGPPKDTGLHRYVFLVFKQKKAIETDNLPVTSNKSREGRLKSKARELIEKFELQDVIAGNFYQAQFDDYVPILHAQLGGAPPKP
ncbi:protein D3-like [Condylostylus longicornis]|uniref:protein D3-like n=1 Tax=Condylostylus longicornis TaxID=2530218 RepID=UPI00244DED34|nr:protein D3-like [Condylostylus longicornis]